MSPGLNIYNTQNSNDGKFQKSIHVLYIQYWCIDGKYKS